MTRNVITAGALVVLCSNPLYAQAPATCLSFKEAVNIQTGRFASGVVIEDFNADGAVDLAVTNQNSNNVSILLGDGTGTFKSKTDFPAGGAPQRIAAADLDGDRNLDLVLPITVANAVAILLGDTEAVPGGCVSRPELTLDSEKRAASSSRRWENRGQADSPAWPTRFNSPNRLRNTFEH